MLSRRWPLLLAALGLAAVAMAADPTEPIRPTEAISLFNGKDLTGFTSWLRESKHEDPKKVFTVRDGMIHISGEGFGYLATDKAYRDYHVTVEYRWGKRTDGGKGVRNSGLLVNAVGPHGGYNNTWMSCVECQIAQGCVGDLIVIRGKDEQGKVIPVSLTSEVVLGSDKRPRWKKGGQVRTFTQGQLWWTQHDPDFKELLDTRGKHDVESKFDDWTARGSRERSGRLRVWVNGTQVNEAYDVFPAAGKILLECEGFEIDFRKFELRPLKK